MTSEQAENPALAGGGSLPQLGLLALGIVLLLIPIVIAIVDPAVLVSAQLYLRILAALGGAFIGAFVPGTIQVTLPWVKGVGALGLFVLIYVANPPAVGASTANPPSSVATTPVPAGSTADQLKKWIAPVAVRGAPAKIDAAHLQLLQQWTSTHDDFKNIPLSVFVTSDNPAIAQARETAIKDLSVPKPLDRAIVSRPVTSLGKPPG